MRYWKVIDPDENFNPIESVFSEEDILRDYYPYWQEEMREVGKTDQITPEACIEDWIVVNWAERCPKPPSTAYQIWSWLRSILNRNK